MCNHVQSLTAIFFLSLCPSADALTYAPVKVHELHSASEQVAIVQIVDGSVLLNGSVECGSKYRGRVIETINGNAPAETIEFGRYEGLEVGTRYALFLFLKGGPYSRMLSTNSDATRELQQRERDCAGLWPKLSARAFRVLWYEEKWKTSRKVLLSASATEIPLSGYGKTVGQHNYPTYDGFVYAPMDEVAAYLRSLP